MRKNVCRIALFSDPHFSVDSQEREEKWFPPLCNIMPKWMTKKFLKFWDNFTQHSFTTLLMRLGAFTPFDLVIGCGDYTPGTNERGMITNKSVEQYKTFEEVYNTILGYAPKILVWGDHDTGYKFDVSAKTGIKIGTEAGGVTIDSVNRAKELIGEPFGILDIGFKKFVWISTNLIRNVGINSNKELRNLQKKQEDFVERILHEAIDGEIVFLLHDPTAINLYEGIGLLLRVNTNKIDVVLHGHMHARWFAKLMRVFYKPYRQFCKLFPVHVIPASWGMLGIGKGFGVMEVFSDKTIKLYWL